jgi:hypothetical protein
MQLLVLFLGSVAVEFRWKSIFVCEIGMLNFPFLMGSTHSELLLPDQLSLSGTDLLLEFSDDLFAYIAYLLVHQECNRSSTWAFSRLGRTSRTTYVVPPWHLLQILSGYEFNKPNPVCCQSAIFFAISCQSAIISSCLALMLCLCIFRFSETEQYTNVVATESYSQMEKCVIWKSDDNDQLSSWSVSCCQYISFFPLQFSTLYTWEELNHENVKKRDELRFLQKPP